MFVKHIFILKLLPQLDIFKKFSGAVKHMFYISKVQSLLRGQQIFRDSPVNAQELYLSLLIADERLRNALINIGSKEADVAKRPGTEAQCSYKRSVNRNVQSFRCDGKKYGQYVRLISYGTNRAIRIKEMQVQGW